MTTTEENKECKFSDRKLKCIDCDTLFTVFGYIRRFQSILHRSNNSYYNIPKSIFNIIAIYYFIPEQWDINCMGNTFIVNDNILIKKEEGYQTAFLLNIVSSGIHHWKFKLIKYNTGYFLRYGIVKCDEIKSKNLTDTRLAKIPHVAYVYNAWTGALMEHTTKNTDIKFENKQQYKAKEGDIIDIYLNMKELTLKFGINNIIYPKFFKIDKYDYVAAVFAYDDNTVIQIVE